MAPSEAICITSWRPFANSLWPGGGHSPRLACCGEGWQRKPRQPSSVRNWGDFSAILTNESCGDGGVASGCSSGTSPRCQPIRRACFAATDGGCLSRGLRSPSHFLRREALPVGGAPLVEMRQRFKTAEPLVLNNRKSPSR
jgi:hypothetical protein